MSGYFQSERYFKDFAEEIRSLFQPLIAPVRESTAGVHLRMGDYLQKTDVYHTPDAAFLNEAFKNLSDNIRTLVVFSDSPDLARKLVEDVPEARRFEIVMDEHETLDALRELTAMQELVLSCSSFSWVGGVAGLPATGFQFKKSGLPEILKMNRIFSAQPGLNFNIEIL